MSKKQRPRCEKCESIINTAYIFRRIKSKIDKWVKIGFYCFHCEIFYPDESFKE